ncbi:hypothetical protein [Psychrobacter sp. L7]|uniref:hypothetical protein n=1 Tax=Psychrobacter sp. L7 TaxID=1982756 RepID=UPI00128FFEE6|nr:hypothetical protein [Psychrobacter sp. L7]
MSAVGTAQEYVTGVTAAATASVGGAVSVSGYYDANVFRGAMQHVSSSVQQSKLGGVSASGGFESVSITSIPSAVERESAKLQGIAQTHRFEADAQLQSSATTKAEAAQFVYTKNKQAFENKRFIGNNRSLKNEQSKLVGERDWLGFEAMAYRQIERALSSDYSKLIADKASELFEQGRFAEIVLQSLAETARLPRTLATCYPPPLAEPIILRAQTTPPLFDVILQVPTCSERDITKITIAASGSVSGVINAQVTAAEGSNGDYTKGVIFVTNSVSLTRTDDGREVKLLGFSVGIDSNSYTWSFSATVPLSELSKVDTAHEQRIGVDFTCNGNLWRFILDSCEDSIQFGESSLTIKGKSRAMLLAHPYATQRGFKFDTAMSARQIADAELNRNGVASGFTLDWQLAGVNGWQVPANTYSYSNRTPINSLQWIAEAAGGFINADMSADILHVLAQYPVPSWEWAAQAPSVELPISLITSRSRGRINKPAYNGVTIYGENDNGIGALIKRTGTSGGYQPPMVTSDLMTDTAAAISRGKMILSDTGDIGNIGISMPLVADIGVLKPSTLIGVNDGEQWVGMVRGTTITGRLSSNRALEIDQSIDVERHFDKEIV